MAKKRKNSETTAKASGGRAASLANLEGRTFRDKPERINKKGRPPKLYTDIQRTYAAHGYGRLTISQINELDELLLQLPEAELRRLYEDSATPQAIRITIRHMNGPRGNEQIERMKDRTYGRAKQTIEANLQPVINIESASPETQRIVTELREKMRLIDEEFAKSQSGEQIVGNPDLPEPG